MTGNGMSHHQPVVPNSFAGAIIQGCELSHPKNTAMVDPNDMVIPKGLNKRMSWNRDAPNFEAFSVTLTAIDVLIWPMRRMSGR